MANIRHPAIVLSSLILASWLLPAMDGAAQTATTHEIILALTPKEADPARTGPRYRSFIPAPDDYDRGITITGDLPPEPERPRINLTVNFEYNSAALTGDGMLTLRALGEALTDPSLNTMTFQIVGHTDQRGTEDYNQHLSERRAASVVDYLVRAHGISSTRLIAIGRGELFPIDPYDHASAKNRRVEIINIGAGS